MTDGARMETVIPKLETKKDFFLAKLDESDRVNIKTIQDSLEEFLHNRGLRGGLIATGDSLNKIPVDNIHIGVVIESGDTIDSYHRSRLDLANHKFDDLVEFSKKITEKDPKFKVANQTEPTVDPQFSPDSILENDGFIRLEKPGSAHIELLNSLTDSTREAIEIQQEQGDPYCVLSKV